MLGDGDESDVGDEVVPEEEQRLPDFEDEPNNENKANQSLRLSYREQDCDSVFLDLHGLSNARRKQPQV